MKSMKWSTTTYFQIHERNLNFVPKDWDLVLLSIYANSMNVSSVFIPKIQLISA